MLLRGYSSHLVILFSISAELHNKLRTVERSLSMKSEKSTLQEEITSLRNQVSDRDKEVLKTKEELMEIQDDKLADVRQQKVKFARLAREKGEEIGKV